MLKQIDAALDRLATGDFGVCAACGEDVSPKRLAAIPWAYCCIGCQARIGSADAPASAHQQAA
jgi:DnaK suppressor protein